MQGCTKCMFCHEQETIKHLFSNCRVAISIWSIIQICSTLYPPRTPCSTANIFGKWLNRVDSMYKTIIGVGAIAEAWSFWLCRNDKVLMTKIHLSCRSFTGVQLCSVHGRHFSVWRIATSLWRCLRGWSIRPRSLFSNMGGSIAAGSKPMEL